MSYRYFRISVLLILLLPSGYLLADNETLNQFAIKMFDPGLIHHTAMGKGQEDLIRLFGEPTTSKRWEEPDDREPGLINDMEHWEYPGIKVTLSSPRLRYKNERRWWIDSVEVTDKRYLLQGDLRIGVSEKRYRAVLGEPYFQKKNVLMYSIEVKQVYKTNVGLYASVDIEIHLNSQGISERIIWRISGD